jgi:hypothetical protein
LNAFLPLVLELKLGVVELKGGRDEVGEDVSGPGDLRLAITTDHVLALPRLADLTDLM